MHIPEKYRDRYDLLALAHPWMREMRDETETIGELIERRTAKIDERNHLIARARNSFRSLADSTLDADGMHEGCRKAAEVMDEEMKRMSIATDGRTLEVAGEPTNGITSETNGIHDGITLPDGDAVAIIRRALDNQSSPTFCALARYLGISGGLSISWLEAEDALRVLADMVERDYVRAEDYNDLALLRAQAERERDEALEIRDKACGDAATFKAERDELKKRVDELRTSQCLECTAVNDTQKRLRDELKARISELEKQWDARDSPDKEAYDRIAKLQDQVDELIDERDEWKAKAEGSSKVRVGQSNLEWLLCESAFSGECKMAMYSKLHYLPKTPWNSFAEFSNWLMAPHVDAHSKAQSKTGPKLSELFGILSDANGDFAPDSDVSADDMDANGANATCDDSGENVTHDSREKLEADVHVECIGGMRRKVCEWLDRQAAITEHECEAKFLDRANYCKMLKSERDQYRELYEAAMSTDYAQVARERDELREKYDKIRSIIDEGQSDGRTDDE